jgi:hypothetical protein
MIQLIVLAVLSLLGILISSIVNGQEKDNGNGKANGLGIEIKKN